MLQNIKNILFRKISKAIVDVLLIIGLIATIISSSSAESTWWSFHCIVSMIWYLLMVIHIWQHWGMTKAVFKWKVLKRNKTTFITVCLFVLMTFSIVFFIVNVSYQSVRFHHVIASLLEKVIIIHLVISTKKFIALFRKKSRIMTLNKI